MDTITWDNENYDLVMPLSKVGSLTYFFEQGYEGYEVEDELELMAIYKEVVNIMSHTLEDPDFEGNIIELFLHFRHDVFSCFCLLKLGLSKKLKTDVHVPYHRQTPDFMDVSDDLVTIYEFTVCSSGGVAQHNKTNSEGRYIYEDFEKATMDYYGLPVKRMLIYFAFNDYNVPDICDTLNCDAVFLDEFYKLSITIKGRRVDPAHIELKLPTNTYSGRTFNSEYKWNYIQVGSELIYHFIRIKGRKKVGVIDWMNGEVRVHSNNKNKKPLLKLEDYLQLCINLNCIPGSIELFYRSDLSKKTPSKQSSKFKYHEDSGLYPILKIINYEPDYPDKLLKYFRGSFKSPGLPEALLPDSAIGFVDKFNNAMVEKNTNHHFYVKSTFIFPIPEDLVYGDFKNIGNFPNLIIPKIIGKYTVNAIKKYSKCEWSNKSSILKDDPIAKKMNALNKELATMMKDKYGLSRRRPKDSDDEDIINKLREVKEHSRKYNRIAKERKGPRWNCVKMPIGKNSANRNDYENEKAHYGKKGFWGVGMGKDLDFFCFMDYLLKTVKSIVTKIYYPGRGSDSETLNRIKNSYEEEFSKFERDFLQSNLANILEFISRFCYVLINSSTNTVNGDHVMLDNLGYENTLILIKGGKKMFSTCKSRMYRLIHPFNVDFKKLLGFDGFSNQMFNIDGINYVVTPWCQMHEARLTNGLSCLHSVCIHLFSATLRKRVGFFELNYNTLIQILLFFHDRRKTEGFMHNSRYLVVNPLGVHSAIDKIITTFAGFNYTYFERWLRNRISMNYNDYYTECKNRESDSIVGKVKNFFTGVLINSDFELTEVIYSTYLMTKAPVDSSIEQSQNILPVLADVKDFNENHDPHNPIFQQCPVWDDNIYKTDFMYDPEMCGLIGDLASSYLCTKTTKAELRTDWANITNQSFDVIANGAGLRGYNKSNFFGKKGYEVVYGFLSEHLKLKSEMPQYSKDIKETIAQVMSEKYRLSNGISDLTITQLIFHIVHKLQRALGREIFAMDIFTKLLQNPIEKFFKRLCKLTDNELISIPSNKRLFKVHKACFESSRDLYTYYFILDCRRWGPHSVFEKYIDSVNCMDILPEEFKGYFNHYAKLHKDKKVITRQHVIDKIKNNHRAKDYFQYLKKSETADDAWEFAFNFSFVMGIHNYLSSFFVAFNVKLSSDINTKVSAENGYLNYYRVLVHSDDSAGIGQCERQDGDILNRSIAIHSRILKGGNHMLSDKKSQTNWGNYFELLSILYLNGTLLPLIPKFTAGMPLSLSDKGYGADIAFCVTKCQEAVLNGSSYCEAFIMMKICENFIRGLYNIRGVYNLDIPYNMMGGLDCHPSLFLVGGMHAETMRFLRYDRIKIKNAIKYAELTGCLQLGLEECSLKWNLGYRVEEPEYDLELPWTVKNFRLPSMKLRYLWYLNKKTDPKFASSLKNEQPSRRLVRIMSAASQFKICTSTGRYNGLEYLAGLIVAKDCEEEDLVLFDEWENLMNTHNFELRNIMKALDELDTSEMSVVDNNLKIKPVYLHVPYPTFFNASNNVEYFLTTQKFEPECLGLYGVPMDLKSYSETVDKYIGLDREWNIEDYYYCVKKLVDSRPRTFYFLTKSKNTQRYVSDLSSFIRHVGVNSYPYREFEFNLNKVRAMDDYANRFTNTLPRLVAEVIEEKRAHDFFRDNGLPMVFKNTEQDLIKKLSDCEPGWEILVKNDSNKQLNLNYYTRVWSEKQIRSGRRWKGKGILLVNLPECQICFEVRDDEIICARLKKGFSFTRASSWYLKNVVLPEIGELNSFIVNTGQSGVRLGFHDTSGIWSCGRNLDVSMILRLEVMEWTEIKGLVMDNIYAGEKLYKINQRDENWFDFDFKQFVDKEALKSLSKEDRIKIFNRVVELRPETYTYIKNMEQSILTTELYRKYYEGRRYCSGGLVESFIEYKKRNKNFGFLDVEDIQHLTSYKNGYTLPDRFDFMFDYLTSTSMSNTSINVVNSYVTQWLQGNDNSLELLVEYCGMSLTAQSILGCVQQTNHIIENIEKFEVIDQMRIVVEALSIMVEMYNERVVHSECNPIELSGHLIHFLMMTTAADHSGLRVANLFLKELTKYLKKSMKYQAKMRLFPIHKTMLPNLDYLNCLSKGMTHILRVGVRDKRYEPHDIGLHNNSVIAVMHKIKPFYKKKSYGFIYNREHNSLLDDELIKEYCQFQEVGEGHNDMSSSNKNIKVYVPINEEYMLQEYRGLAKTVNIVTPYRPDRCRYPILQLKYQYSIKMCNDFIDTPKIFETKVADISEFDYEKTPLSHTEIRLKEIPPKLAPVARLEKELRSKLESSSKSKKDRLESIIEDSVDKWKSGEINHPSGGRLSFLRNRRKKLAMLTDPQILAEFNTISKGLWRKIETKQVRLTKLQKSSLLRNYKHGRIDAINDSEYSAWGIILKEIISEATDGKDDSLYSDLNVFTEKMLSDEDDDPNDMPAPIYSAYSGIPLIPGLTDLD